MTTSALSRQLALVADGARQVINSKGNSTVNRSFVGNNGINKFKASVLFTPGEAADHDAQTIFQLGLRGLDDLIEEHGAEELIEYRESLFDRNLTERNFLDRDTERALNGTVELFLAAIGPYIALPTTLRVLEFLIRQFEIHIYNSTRLLAVALPYHETPVFEKLLQLPCKVSGGIFAFLEGRKTRLSRAHIEKACCSDLQLLQSINEVIDINPHEVALRFWSVLSASVIAIRRSECVEVVLPGVLRALKAKSPHHEREKGACLVACQLVKYGSLSSKACKLLLLASRKCAGRGVDVLTIALQSAAQIFFYSDDGVLPSGFVKAVVKRSNNDNDELENSFIAAFGERGEIADSFVSAFFSGLLALGKLHILRKLIRFREFYGVDNFFMELANYYFNAKRGERADVESLATSLANLYPDSVEKVILHEDQCWKLALASLAGTSLECFEGAKLSKNGKRMTMRMALGDAIASVRLRALQSLSLSETDLPLVSDRLSDEVPDISAEALELLLRQQKIIKGISPASKRSLLSALHSGLSIHYGDARFLKLSLKLFDRLNDLNLVNTILCGEASCEDDAEVVSDLLLYLCLLEDFEFIESSIDPGILALVVDCAVRMESTVTFPKLIALIGRHLEFCHQKGTELKEKEKQLVLSAFRLGLSSSLFSELVEEDLVSKVPSLLSGLVQHCFDELPSSLFTSSCSSLPLPMLVLCHVLNADEHVFKRIFSNVVAQLVESCFRSTSLQCFLFIGCGVIRMVDTNGKRRALNLAEAAIGALHEKYSFIEILPFLFGPLSDAQSSVRVAALSCLKATSSSFEVERTFSLFKADGENQEIALNKDPVSAMVSTLVGRLLESQAAIVDDRWMVSKIFKTTNDSEALYSALLQPAVAFVNTSNQLTSFHNDDSLNLVRLIENTLKPVMCMPAKLHGNSINLARAAVKADCVRLLDLASTMWTDPECPLDIDFLVFCISEESPFGARRLALNKWLPRIMPRLESSTQEVIVLSALDMLHVSSAREETKAALQGLNLPCDLILKVIASFEIKTSSDLNAILEICRVALFNPENETSTELRGLLSALFRLLDVHSSVEDPLLAICTERCLTAVYASDGSRPLQINIDLLLDQILSAKTAPFRNSLFQLLRTVCKTLGIHEVLVKIGPVLRKYGGIDGTGGDHQYLFVLLEQITLAFKASLVNEDAFETTEEVAREVEQICSVFVDACSKSGYVARSLNLLEVLAATVHALPVVLRLLLADETAAEDCGNAEHRLWIARQVCSRFSVNLQIEAFVELINEIEFSRSSMGSVRTCQLVENAVGSKEFLHGIHNISQNEDDTDKRLVSLITSLHGRICELDSCESEVRTALTSILDKTVTLLDVEIFLAVINGLLRDDNEFVRNLAVRELAVKFEQRRRHWQAEELALFLEMITQMGEMVNTEDSNVNRQTAMLCIDTIARFIGPRKPDAFLFLMDPIVSALLSFDQNSNNDYAFLSSACLCLGTLVSVLGKQALKFLPRYFPVLLSLLDSGIASKPPNLMLAQSASSCIHSVVSTLTSFLSPYLCDLFLALGHTNDQGSPSLLRATSEKTGEALAKGTEFRLLIEPLKNAIGRQLREHRPGQTKALFKVLDLAILEANHDVLANELEPLTSLFAELLSGRAALVNFVEEHIYEFEDTLANTYLSLILNLRSSRVRKSFRSLVAWKLEGTSKSSDLLSSEDVGIEKKRKQREDEGSGEIDEISKSSSLYFVCIKLGKKLQSLSAPYTALLVPSSITDAMIPASKYMLLWNDNAPKKKLRGQVDRHGVLGSEQQRVLRRRVMEVMRIYCEYGPQKALFENDDEGPQFGDLLSCVTKNMDIEHVTVTGLETNAEESAKYYLEWIDNSIAPTLVALARAAATETSWQTLHHAVLEMATHSFPAVRIGVIRCIVSLFEDIGESYLILLAETLPTIAELLEDKDHNVKQAAHKAARKLQQLSGEDLGTFLN